MRKPKSDLRFEKRKAPVVELDRSLICDRVRSNRVVNSIQRSNLIYHAMTRIVRSSNLEIKECSNNVLTHVARGKHQLRPAAAPPPDVIINHFYFD